MPARVTGLLTQSGAQRHILYDPGFSKQDNDTLWNFAVVGNSGFRVVGYTPTFPETPRLIATNINDSLSVLKPITVAGVAYTPTPVERVLFADVIISTNPNRNPANRNFTRVDGGFKGHSTSHLNGNIPAGGNLLFLDGHNEWRKFGARWLASAMSLRGDFRRCPVIAPLTTAFSTFATRLRNDAGCIAGHDFGRAVDFLDLHFMSRRASISD